jgi:hypothetical protein
VLKSQFSDMALCDSALIMAWVYQKSRAPVVTIGGRGRGEGGGNTRIGCCAKTEHAAKARGSYKRLPPQSYARVHKAQGGLIVLLSQCSGMAVCDSALIVP